MSHDASQSEQIRDLQRRFQSGELGRRNFLRQVVQLGVTSSAAYALLGQAAAFGQSATTMAFINGRPEEEVNQPYQPPMNPSTRAMGEEGTATTMRVGEEGQATTLRVGEEDSRPVTTQRVGEESTPTTAPLPCGNPEEIVIQPQPTTQAVGEEGGVATTYAVGEEGQPTTMAFVNGRPEEEVHQGQPTTQAVGEEGQATTTMMGEEGQPVPSTRAQGEEGQPPATTMAFINGRPEEEVHQSAPINNPTTQAVGEEQSVPTYQPQQGVPIQQEWNGWRRW